jgi:hypothetical protein
VIFINIIPHTHLEPLVLLAKSAPISLLFGITPPNHSTHYLFLFLPILQSDVPTLLKEVYFLYEFKALFHPILKTRF